MDSAKRTGATPDDRGDHLQLVERNKIAKSLQACRCVLPQGSGNEAIETKGRRYFCRGGILPNTFSIASRALVSAVSVKCKYTIVVASDECPMYFWITFKLTPASSKCVA